MVLVLLRILNTCIQNICDVCVWSDQSEFMAVFVVFNLQIGPCLIFESCFQ